LADTARTARAERLSACILIAGIGLGVVLRFIALGAQSLWVDELLTIKNAHIGEPGIFSYIAHNLQGPAASLLTHYVGAMGKSEALLRLPFAVAGALSVPAIYVLARQFSGKWSSLHTTLLLALSPIHIWYSQEVRGYAFVVLFSILATYLLVRWVKEKRPSLLALYGICLFAGLVSNLSMAFVAMAHLAYLIIRRHRLRVLLWWGVAICVVLVAFSPWIKEVMVRVQPQKVVAGDTRAPLIAGSDFTLMAVPYALFTFGAGYTLGPSPRDLQTDRRGALQRNAGHILLAAIALAIPLIVGLVRAAGTDRDLFTLLLVWMALPAIVVALVAAGNIKPFNPRYMLVSLPAFVVLLGTGAAGLTRSRYVFLLAPLVAVLALSIGNYFGNAHYARDDFRTAAQTIEGGYRDDDVIAAVFTVEPLEFYLDGTASVEVFGRNDLSSPAAMRDRCRSLTGDANRVWLSLCREWQVDPDAVIYGWFEDNLERVGSYSFTGVRLFLYKSRGV